MKIDRASAIRQHLYSVGPSSVADLAAAIGASEPTVRRDLSALEEAGVVERTHGGARIAAASGAEVAFEQREQINLAAKRAIGEAAHALLRPETAVFLDAGTTVLQLARCLRLHPLPLRIFTNCLPVAQLLLPVPGLTITLLGGTLRAQNASVVGPLAEDALERLWFDQLFLGVGAVSDSGDIASVDEQEARLNRHMLTRSAETVLMADADKFGPRLTWAVAPLPEAAQVITDARLSADWRARLAERGCRVTLT
jgi:DeoR family fructose operon transcriptional repressor